MNGDGYEANLGSFNNAISELLSLSGKLSMTFKGEFISFLKVKSLDKSDVESKEVMDVDYAIATTGKPCPTGGTEEKPVGTVWIAVAGTQKIITKKFVFVGKSRERNILRTSQTALQLLRKLILKEKIGD